MREYQHHEVINQQMLSKAGEPPGFISINEEAANMRRHSSKLKFMPEKDPIAKAEPKGLKRYKKPKKTWLHKLINKLTFGHLYK